MRKGDSIEIFIDSLNDGGEKPQFDDFQLNLGIHGHYLLLKGTGSGWTDWHVLPEFAVVLKGELNDDSSNDEGYIMEVMIPYRHMGLTEGGAIGLSFGQANKRSPNESDFSWKGLTFNGQYINPQSPDKYITYTLDNTFILEEASS